MALLTRKVEGDDRNDLAHLRVLAIDRSARVTASSIGNTNSCLRGEVGTRQERLLRVNADTAQTRCGPLQEMVDLDRRALLASAAAVTDNHLGANLFALGG